MIDGRGRDTARAVALRRKGREEEEEGKRRGVCEGGPHLCTKGQLSSVVNGGQEINSENERKKGGREADRQARRGG